MSKLSDEFQLPLPLDDASWACRQAVSSVGWNVESVEPHRIVPKVGVGISRNPSKIEVLLTEASDTATTITLNGRIMGMGPLQKRHLRGEMNRLRNAIEVSAHDSARPS